MLVAKFQHFLREQGYAHRRTSEKRPYQFPHARGGIVVCGRRCGREADGADIAGKPQRRRAVSGGKSVAGTRANATAAEWRRLENGTSARAGGVRSRAGWISVRLCDFGA